MRIALCVMVPLISVLLARARDPECAGADSWPATMAFVHLKNAGLARNDTVDFGRTKVVRIASEKIGKDLYRQVHRVIFAETSGNLIEIITINDASHQECSEIGVDVFVVARHLGPK